MDENQLNVLKYAEMRVVHRILCRQKEMVSHSLLNLDRLLYLQKCINLLKLDEIKENLAEKLPHILSIRFFSLFLYDKDKKILSLTCHNRPDLPETMTLHINESGVMREALEKGAYILEPDYTKSRYFQGRVNPIFNCNFFLSIPLMIESEIIGILNLNDNARGMFSVEELDFILNVSEFLALAISNALNFVKIEKLSISDGLTGLYNRQYMARTLESETARARRYDAPLAVVIFDVDHFKKVNDEFGHQKGDEVLMAVADVLRRISRSNDMPARYGGEEFLLLLPETRSAGAMLIAERLRNEISGLRFQGIDRPVTISCGVAELDKNRMATTHDFIHTADVALYKAKNSGRNRSILGTVDAPAQA